jgi:hypothetical protein
MKEWQCLFPAFFPEKKQTSGLLKLEKTSLSAKWNLLRFLPLQIWLIRIAALIPDAEAAPAGI